LWRGDSHYSRVEAMEWAEDHDAEYIFGLADNAALDALVGRPLSICASSCDEAARRSCAPMRGSCIRPGVGGAQGRGSAGMLAAVGRTGMRQEVDIRYVVTSLKGCAQYLYEHIYCQRG